ncbi:hypothetical protein AL546_009470 [Vibrio vulnificus]|nr:hypothetical protein AL546_009470 [Vibrio vulnificus]
MNALLCLNFNKLRFTKTKINSALTHKQKPKTKNQKTEMTHNFENQTLNFASQNEKPKIKLLIEPTALTSRMPEN